MLEKIKNWLFSKFPSPPWLQVGNLVCMSTPEGVYKGVITKISSSHIDIVWFYDGSQIYEIETVTIDWLRSAMRVSPRKIRAVTIFTPEMRNRDIGYGLRYCQEDYK